MELADFIIGTHSIEAALRNPRRSHVELICTDEGWNEFLKRSKIDARQLTIKPRLLSPHSLQEEARHHYQERDLEYQRVPGQIYLISEPLEEYDPGWLRQKAADSSNLRILALDQISDVHNGGAILRSACFFGVQIVILPQQKSFGLTPSFFRIASGATEHIQIVRSSHLTRTLTMLKEEQVEVWGLSEHASENLGTDGISSSKVCLVLGSEDDGLSHGVMRIVSKTLSLKSQGAIKSLNVAAAAALAMQLSFPAR